MDFILRAQNNCYQQKHRGRTKTKAKIEQIFYQPLSNRSTPWESIVHQDNPQIKQRVFEYLI